MIVARICSGCSPADQIKGDLGVDELEKQLQEKINAEMEKIKQQVEDEINKKMSSIMAAIPNITMPTLPPIPNITMPNVTRYVVTYVQS